MYVCDKYMGWKGGGGGRVSETAVPDPRAGAGAEQDGCFLGCVRLSEGGGGRGSWANDRPGQGFSPGKNRLKWEFFGT